MLKAIIIDDERKSRETLETLIGDFLEGIGVVDTADNVNSGLKAIERHSPDVVFLDVEMPKRNGFELLDQFPDHSFDVIFTTGHSEYAMKAFRTEAVDYLLKPVAIDQLKEAVQRVERKKAERNQLQGQTSLPQKKQQLSISTSRGLIFLPIDDIIYCRGDGAYTYFFTKDGQKIVVSKNLKEYERQLSDYHFFRTHKSFLINMDEMKRYIRGDGGYVVMSNGDSVGVSKRRKENFLAALANAS
jgi:two-component system LytT family response regulator